MATEQWLILLLAAVALLAASYLFARRLISRRERQYSPDRVDEDQATLPPESGRAPEVLGGDRVLPTTKGDDEPGSDGRETPPETTGAPTERDEAALEKQRAQLHRVGDEARRHRIELEQAREQASRRVGEVARARGEAEQHHSEFERALDETRQRIRELEQAQEAAEQQVREIDRAREEADLRIESLDRLTSELDRLSDSLRTTGEATARESLDVAAKQPDGETYPVFFGSNRAVVMAGGDVEFLPERSSSVSYGVCAIFVPSSHKIGSTGSSFIRRWLTGQDDRIKLYRTYVVDRVDFWKLVDSHTLDVKDGDAVVFIHGYNTSFRDAAIRTAQIGVDLGVRGPMAFFSWPSKGTVLGYAADTASIEASEGVIADFLVDFARYTHANAIHVIAHSMGNRGVLRAMNRIAQNAESRSHARFGQFVLAAADVDAGTFRELADAYRSLARRTTLYVSANDQAIGLSKWVYDHPRIGFEPPISVFPGVDTITVTDMDMTLLGHGYVSKARGVLSDMHSLILQGLPPEQRFSLSQLQTDQGESYWRIRA